ncbi:MAG: hypothetical protein KGL35_31815 [Bradyrhizobium sp.]|uniref:hypothetical protein n=1 Tax=Bradyrhizobium sp. TaxID=376 RepID=UPI00238E666B|nr:hypothetical protein [Bradyrhizobium sp.]MDE2473173.1 hypothetical protein [Bradyrhizobium sp.]
MTDSDVVAGKAGFQKADLMDYGSLYGMGSYFSQDYTAFGLMRQLLSHRRLDCGIDQWISEMNRCLPSSGLIVAGRLGSGNSRGSKP